MKLQATSVCGLQATSVYGLKLLVYAALSTVYEALKGATCMQVALERLRECREAWADDREGHKVLSLLAVLVQKYKY
jgi:hypothetical protein